MPDGWLESGLKGNFEKFRRKVAKMLIYIYLHKCFLPAELAVERKRRASEAESMVGTGGEAEEKGGHLQISGYKYL